MIQFNLLPDIKLQYVKSRRTKHLVFVAATIVGGVSLGVLVLLFTGVNVLQKRHLNNLSSDIKVYSAQLENVQDLDKILTIQNQLSSLDSLHDNKPAVTRLFNFLPKFTPNAVTITKLDLDFSAGTISISGNADSISTINKFTDTLKFTKYTVDGKQPETDNNAFTKVVLTSFALNTEEKDTAKKASYQISLNFNIAIFDNTKNVDLAVPNIISTRSETEKPRALFDEPAAGSSTEGQ